jgi:hypothetical protein
MCSMKAIKKLVAVTGKYTDQQTGVEKNRYVNIGRMFKDDGDGHISLKLESLPIGSEWNGWVSVYDLDSKGATQAAATSGQQAPARAPVAQQAPTDYDSDIPF